jgi:PadR family transcriptional regulator, regulatory protein PadR
VPKPHCSAEADTVPNQLGVAYNAHVIEAILTPRGPRSGLALIPERFIGVRYSCEMAKGQRDIFAGLIRLHVLHHACQEPIYGLEMIQELSRHGYKLGPGTVYPLLHGMEEIGLLRSKQQAGGGRPRRVYTATAAGRRALAEAHDKVRELLREMDEGE